MSSDSDLSDFSESSNDNEDVDVEYSRYMPYSIAITTLRHQDILAARFEDCFREQSRSIFRRRKITNCFQTRFKLWNSVLKRLNFQNIEKLAI